MEGQEILDKKFQKELNAGITALILLSVLNQTDEPMYGYQIAKSLEASGEDVPMMKQGALYPVLRSLQASGLLDSHVEPSVSGPPRRYYQITPQGRDALQSWIQIWHRNKRLVGAVLEENRHA